MNDEMKAFIAAIPEYKQAAARTFWERTYDTVISKSVHDQAVTQRGPSREQITTAAAKTADDAVRHWAERW